MSMNPSPENEVMNLEKKPWYEDIRKQFSALWYGLAGHGPKVALQGTIEILSRWIRGAPMSRYSEISPQITVSGQYGRRGWKILAKRGITAVINMRTEWDDQAAGIAPPRYMHLKVIDNTPPSLEMLQAGVDFISQEIAAGGKVYIHCAAGVGRAPTMAAAYLISTGLTPDAALQQIRSIRPFIRPTAEQIAQLVAYAAKLKAEASGKAASGLDVALEMAVSTAPVESTVAIDSAAPIKIIPPLGTGEALEAGMPSQLGAIVKGDATPKSSAEASSNTKAKDVAQNEGGTKVEEEE